MIKKELIINCKISQKDLRKLYKKLCVNPNSENKYCDKCPLGSIKYIAGKINNCERDMCFGIWHNAIIKI
jgi:hypothetical protein